MLSNAYLDCREREFTSYTCKEIPCGEMFVRSCGYPCLMTKQMTVTKKLASIQSIVSSVSNLNVIYYSSYGGAAARGWQWLGNYCFCGVVGTVEGGRAPTKI